MIVTFTLTHVPSKSKGWGRYSADGHVRSSTGNAFVYGDKTAELAPGTTLEVKVQGMNRTKSHKETIATITAKLVVEEGAECEVTASPGSQPVTVRISGARVA